MTGKHSVMALVAGKFKCIHQDDEHTHFWVCLHEAILDNPPHGQRAELFQRQFIICFHFLPHLHTDLYKSSGEEALLS